MPQLLDPFTRLAPAAVATGPAGRRRIDLFLVLPPVAGSTRGNLWHRWWIEGRGWRSRWLQRGGFWNQHVAAAAYSGGRVDLFGLDADGSLVHAYGTGDALNRAGDWPRETIGRPDGREITSSAVATATGPANFRVAVRTRHTRRGAEGIWFARFDATEFGRTPPGWQWQRRLDPEQKWPEAHSYFATGLGMTWRKPGALDLFVVTRDMTLEHTWLDGRTTSPWGGFRGRTEGKLTSTPSVVPWWNSNDPDQSSMHVVSCYGPFSGPLGYRDPGRVELKSWAGRHWEQQRTIYTEGQTDSRYLASPPVVTSWGRPRLDVFFLSESAPGRLDFQVTHGWAENLRQWRWEHLAGPERALGG